MIHFFDADLAKEYGILEAVLLSHLYYWVDKNKANGRNFHDGYYWTYNSTKAFAIQFPYVSTRKIQYALKHLKEEGLIQTGNYNDAPYDRTLWYAFTDFGQSIMQKCKMDNVNLSNGNVNFVKPIPNNKPNNIPNNIPNSILGQNAKTSKAIPSSVEEVRTYCNERNNKIDPERFVDYYQSKGWMVGKNKMKDWKAAVRTWERNNKDDLDINHELDGVF